MGEITEIVSLYVEKEVFPELVDEITGQFETQTKLALNEAMNDYTPTTMYTKSGKRRYARTGRTAASIGSEIVSNDGKTAIIRAYTSGFPEYTVYVDENSIWGGHHFFENGLKRIVELYG